jgi:hypothetical protein
MERNQREENRKRNRGREVEIEGIEWTKNG